MKIYVGSLSSDVTEADLRQVFEAFGQVTSATVMKDKFSVEARGFGFVEMPVQTEAYAAVQGLNGKVLKGRSLSVRQARPRGEGRRDGAIVVGGPHP